MDNFILQDNQQGNLNQQQGRFQQGNLYQQQGRQRDNLYQQQGQENGNNTNQQKNNDKKRVRTVGSRQKNCENKKKRNNDELNEL